MSYNFVLISFYEDSSQPEIQRFKQDKCDLVYYADNLLKGSFCIADKKNRIPFLVVLYVNGKFLNFASSIERKKEGFGRYCR